MYLFFDTETNGPPRSCDAPLADLDNWPRMVQIAWLLTDSLGQELDSFSSLIRPDGWEIPEETARLHGITTERAEATGLPAIQVLDRFACRACLADVMVAHNIEFDSRIIGAEHLRYRRPVGIVRWSYCTMRETANLVKLPGRYGDYKFPRLAELYQHLFGESFDGAHDAMADVRACARCYWRLRGLGHVCLPPAPDTAQVGMSITERALAAERAELRRAKERLDSPSITEDDLIRRNIAERRVREIEKVLAEERAAAQALRDEAADIRAAGLGPGSEDMRGDW